jgi:hypothetical protein
LTLYVSYVYIYIYIYVIYIYIYKSAHEVLPIAFLLFTEPV